MFCTIQQSVFKFLNILTKSDYDKLLNLFQKRLYSSHTLFKEVQSAICSQNNEIKLAQIWVCVQHVLSDLFPAPFCLALCVL